jgi:hypothetical protein
MHTKRKGKQAIDLLHQHDTRGEDFLLQFVTEEETWVHQFKPKSKWQSMEWCLMTFPRKEKL